MPGTKVYSLISLIDRVRNYIKNQEEYHKVTTFQKEYDELMREYGFG